MTSGSSDVPPRRRALVTGGGTGIGLATARRLAVDGADVVVVGRRSDVLASAADEINTAAGGRQAAVAYTADVTDPDQVEAMAAAVGAAGPLHVLFNNAGGVSPGGDATLHEAADRWGRDFTLNVLSTVLTTQALLPYLARPGGRVVAMSSLAAMRGSGSYGAAKAALHAWTYHMANQLAPDGITVNAVAPGFVPDTAFWDGRLAGDETSRRVAQIPLGRPGTPEEVADAVAYLAGEQAGWTTGQILQVNGGVMPGRG